jgi:hypothetical protein
LKTEIIRVNSKLTNDFFSNSQRLNFVSCPIIWLIISRFAGFGQWRTGVRQPPMPNMFSKFGTILLDLMEAVCVHKMLRVVTF